MTDRDLGKDKLDDIAAEADRIKPGTEVVAMRSFLQGALMGVAMRHLAVEDSALRQPVLVDQPLLPNGLYERYFTIELASGMRFVVTVEPQGWVTEAETE